MTICAACHRPLKKPAVKHGHAAFGPKCAAKFGLMPSKKQAAAIRDDKTPDLFEEKKGT